MLPFGRAVFFLFVLVLITFLYVPACAPRIADQGSSSLCGASLPSSEVDGLTWLAGSPTQANVLCHVRNQRAQVLLSLDPESRDPVLFRERTEGQQFLVERFSGRQARPSRVTWFSSVGEKLGQRGDWLQNVYAIAPLSADEALITGFDFSAVQRVSLKKEEFAAPLGDSLSVQVQSEGRPVHTLVRNSTWAVIDSGFDLVQFKPTVVKISLIEKGRQLTQTAPRAVEDARTGRACFNAFQVLPLSAHAVVLSCNPQYFGPTRGQSVVLFQVSLLSDGSIESRELLAFDGAEIQRIDLWGVDDQSEQVFVGLKTTTGENYEGLVVRAGWLSLKTMDWTPEQRFVGPFFRNAQKNFAVVACAKNTEQCSQGQFVFVPGQLPWAENVSGRSLSLQAKLPFLSFAQELR